MTKKMIVMMMLAALILIPTQPRAVADTIEKARTVSKYVTLKINGTAYTISGTVNYDKKGGLLNMDYISWHGNVSHNKKECSTDYVMYFGKEKYKTMHLPFVQDHQRTFYKEKNVSAKNYSYAKMDMDTPDKKYTLRANE